jgi:hypothetical protein
VTSCSTISAGVALAQVVGREQDGVEGGEGRQDLLGRQHAEVADVPAAGERALGEAVLQRSEDFDAEVEALEARGRLEDLVDPLCRPQLADVHEAARPAGRSGGRRRRCAWQGSAVRIPAEALGGHAPSEGLHESMGLEQHAIRAQGRAHGRAPQCTHLLVLCVERAAELSQHEGPPEQARQQDQRWTEQHRAGRRGVEGHYVRAADRGGSSAEEPARGA